MWTLYLAFSSPVELVNGKMTASKCQECPWLMVGSVKPLTAAEPEQTTSGEGVIFLLWFSAHRVRILEAILRCFRMHLKMPERGWSILRRLEIIVLSICKFKRYQKLLDWCQVVRLPLKSAKREVAPPDT